METVARMVGLARRTDPVTSHEAAESLSDEALVGAQREVVDILTINGGLADVDIASVHEFRHARGITELNLSEQRLRTARAELVRAGRVVATGREVLTPRGRRAVVWGLA